jgi:hypothetical protein
MLPFYLISETLAPIQVGAVFAILSTVLGGFASLKLFSAICFELSVCTILAIAIVYVACAVFSLLTLVYGAFDLCDHLGYDNDNSVGGDSYYPYSSECDLHRIRLDQGAVAEIFGAIFYVGAAAIMFRFYCLAKTNRLSEESSSGNNAEPTRTDEEMLPLYSKVKAIKTRVEEASHAGAAASSC